MTTSPLIFFFFGGAASKATATGTFSEKAVHASLMQYFSANFSESGSTVFDEEPFDFEGATEAVEINITMMDSPPRRSGNKEFIECTIEMHCWAKKSTNLYRVLEIADQAAATFDQVVVTVADYDTSGNPTVGYTRCREAHIEDVTREMEEVQRTDGRHAVVTIEAVAQAI